MGLFLLQRWRRQPQGPVRVDWGNPLSAGLRYAVLPHYRDREIAFGRIAATKTIYGFGTASQHDKYATGKYGAVLVSKQRVDFGEVGYDRAMPMSWVAGIVPNSNTGDAFSRRIFSYTFGNAGFVIGYSLNEIDFTALNSYGLQSVGLTSSAEYEKVIDVAVTNTWHVGAGGGSGHFVRMYRDGRLLTEHTNTGGWFENPGMTAVFGVADSLLAPHTAYQFVFQRRPVLSQAEIAAIHENPWQLFAPLRQTIYSLPSVAWTYSRPRIDVAGGSGWSVYP